MIRGVGRGSYDKRCRGEAVEGGSYNKSCRERGI